MADNASFGTRAPKTNYTPRPAAYVVILNEANQVACVETTSGLFLPGGGIEAGEDPVAAVHREVAEECARSLEIIAELGAAVQFFRTAKGKAYELQASFFLGRFGPALDGPQEHPLHWLAATSLPPSIYHQCHAWAVGRALAMLTDD